MATEWKEWVQRVECPDVRPDPFLLLHIISECSESDHTAFLKGMVNPFARPIFVYASRISAVLAGRFLRKWWSRQPPERKNFISKHVSSNRWKYIGTTGLIGYSAYDGYRKRLFLTPFTGRERFMLCSHQEIMEIQNINCKQLLLLYADHTYPQNHPEVMRLRNIVQRIIRANKDIPKLFNIHWTVMIIDSPIPNCLVLENGYIMMHKGMLDIMDNNIHQTATVLAHEMSHVLLDHNSEKYSDIVLVENLKLLPYMLLWAFLPTDLLAAINTYVFNKGVSLLHELPHSRRIEEEADVVGLFLMASACYDVREASAFWGKMDIIDATKGKKGWLSEFDWFSTHPSNQNRQLLINKFMKDAIHIRNLKKCPSLKRRDPRQFYESVRQILPETLSMPALDQLSVRQDYHKFEETARFFTALRTK